MTKIGSLQPYSKLRSFNFHFFFGVVTTNFGDKTEPTKLRGNKFFVLGFQIIIVELGFYVQVLLFLIKFERH